MVVERSRILPPLITLATYLQRSGAPAFKRLTGLSSFEAWVLTEIGKDPPLDWGRLVRALERDHSQAGRTVRHLSERGLIERHGRPGRRNGSFSPTPEGMRLFTLISGAGQQRSEFLLQDIPAPQLSRFLAWCDVIMRNAEAQLEREHAVEEIHSGREVHQTA
jgi:DNA-binding MarR family transcriptional regulator